MTVGQLKKFLRCIDRELEVKFKCGEEYYDLDHIYIDQLENNLICELQLL